MNAYLFGNDLTNNFSFDLNIYLNTHRQIGRRLSNTLMHCKLVFLSDFQIYSCIFSNVSIPSLQQKKFVPA